MGLGTSAIEAGKAYVRLYTDSSEYVKGLRSAEAKLNAFANNIGSLGARMTAFASMAALPIALSAKTFANFQDQMLAVKAAANATGDEFQRLYDQAKKLGATTSFTAAEVGAGQLGLAKAGFGPAEIEAAIPAVLNLARATGTELATATEIATGSLRAFNLEAKEMPRVVDVLTAAANASDAGIEDIGEAMKIAAPVAKEYGLTLEQTAKSLGVLANLQIKGTMAGTSLRQIMLQLADPKVQERLRGMGIEVLDASKNLRPLGDVMVEIGKKMAGMGTGERLALGKELFDQRAISAGLVLSTQKFDELSDAIDNAAGIASRTAKTMDSGLGGMFRILMSAVEGVQIALGEGLTETLTKWGTTATDVAGSVQKWIQNNRSLVNILTTMIAAVGTAGIALIAFGAAAKGAAIAVGATTLAIGVLNKSLTLLAAHPVVATVLLAVAAYEALGTWIDASAASAINASYALDKLAGAQVAADASSTELRVALQERMDTMQRLADAIKAVADSWMTASKKESMIADLSAELQTAKDEANALLDRLKQIKTTKESNTDDTVEVMNDELRYKRPPKETDVEEMITAEQEKRLQTLQDQIKEQGIRNWRAGYFGDDPKFADKEEQEMLIELERKKELRDANGNPAITDMINKLYDAKLRFVEYESEARQFEPEPFGTTSAEEAWRMGLGTKTDTAAEKTAKATEKTAKATEETVKEIKNVGRAISASGKMTG